MTTYLMIFYAIGVAASLLEQRQRPARIRGPIPWWAAVPLSLFWPVLLLAGVLRDWSL